MNVFELSHLYYLFEDTPCYSPKGLGLYTTEEHLHQAIAYYQKQPGFCDAPNGFLVKRRTVTGEVTADCVYEALVYAHTEDYCDFEYDHSIGLFADCDAAEKELKVFCEDNALFINNRSLVIEKMVVKCNLNLMDQWSEGFAVEPVEEE